MKTSSNAWRVVALLWLVWLLNYMDRQVIFSVFPLLRTDLRLTDLQLGLLGTAFLWVYAAFSPFAGFLGDRYGRKRIVVISLLVWSVVTWATGHARSFHELVLARAVMGISEACYLPAGLALIADYHSGKTRSMATGIHYTGGYLGMVLGGFCGGWMAQRYGWRLGFTVFGGFGVIYSLVLMALLNDKQPQYQPARDNPAPGLSFFPALRELFGLKGFTILTLVFSATSIANWILYTWMPLFLYERFHMSLAWAGFASTFYLQFGSLAGVLSGGYLADRWINRTPSGRIFTQAGGLMATAPFLFLVGLAGSPVLIVAALAVFGLGRGAYDCNCMPVLCQFARADQRSTGYGVFNFAGCLAGGAAAAAAGALKSTLGLGGTIQLAGVLILISGFLLLRLGLQQDSLASPKPYAA